MRRNTSSTLSAVTSLGCNAAMTVVETHLSRLATFCFNMLDGPRCSPWRRKIWAALMLVQPFRYPYE